MEQSRATTNPVASTSSSSTGKKRMKTQTTSSSSSNPNFSWKSSSTQQQYSSKLLSSLRHIHTTPPSPSPSAPRRSRAVREAADKGLAAAAKGRTRWSRAILTNKIKLKYLNHKHKRQKVNVNGVKRSPPATKILSLKKNGKELPEVDRKVKTLGRLVPGCRRESIPVILEEATDYIPALEMQIRVMRDLLSLLSTAATNADGGGY